VSALTDPIDPAFVRGFQQSTLTRPVPPEFFDMIVGESMKVPARVWKAALEPYRTANFVSRLTTIRVPTLLVWGDRDAFTLRADQDGLVQAIPGARLVVYTGTGHCPHWEEPERFAKEIVSFIPRT
jgi:pimeloyl-ACP methyl ester carboxylesterase